MVIVSHSDETMETGRTQEGVIMLSKVAKQLLQKLRKVQRDRLISIDIVTVCKDIADGNELYSACIALKSQGLFAFDTKSQLTEIHHDKKVIVGFYGHLTEQGLKAEFPT